MDRLGFEARKGTGLVQGPRGVSFDASSQAKHVAENAIKVGEEPAEASVPCATTDPFGSSKDPEDAGVTSDPSGYNKDPEDAGVTLLRLILERLVRLEKQVEDVRLAVVTQARTSHQHVEQTVEVEVPQMQYEDQIVHVPVQKQVHVPMVQKVQKEVEVPQIQYEDQGSSMEVPQVDTLKNYLQAPDAGVGPMMPPAVPAPKELPSLGSEGHPDACKPCAFLHDKGCRYGAKCRFCHVCERGAKRRQKAKKGSTQEHKPFKHWQPSKDNDKEQEATGQWSYATFLKERAEDGGPRYQGARGSREADGWRYQAPHESREDGGRSDDDSEDERAEFEFWHSAKAPLPKRIRSMLRGDPQRKEALPTREYIVDC